MISGFLFAPVMNTGLVYLCISI